MVESVELVGNSNSNSSSSSSSIMITAGGSDGKIRFWDWNTFTCLGYLSIHPGRLIDVLLPPNNPAVAAAAGRSSGAVSSPHQQQQQQRLYYSPVDQLISVMNVHH